MKHSPDPWTYDTGTYKVYDAEGEEVATVYGYDDADTHANGHRIVALSAENAALRATIEATAEALENGGFVIAMSLIEASDRDVALKSLARTGEEIAALAKRLRTALRAGGAET